MKRTISFVYKVPFVPKGMRKEREAWFQASAEIDLQEVPRAETERVATLADTKDGRQWSEHNAFVPRADGSPREIIGWGNSLWVEYDDPDKLFDHFDEGKTANTPFDIPLLDSPRATTHDGRPRHVILSSIDQVRNLSYQTCGTSHLSSFEDDGGARALDQLRKRLASIIVVDGTAYCRCAEPVLVKDRFATRGNKVLISSTTTYDYADELWRVGASGSVLANGSKTNLADGTLGKSLRVEVHAPSRLMQASHVSGVLTKCEEILKTLWPTIHGLPPRFISVATALRDAYADCKDQVTPDILRTLKELASLEPQSMEELAELAARVTRRYVVSPEEAARNHRKAQPTIAALRTQTMQIQHDAIAAATAALGIYAKRRPGVSWEENALGPDLTGLVGPGTTEILSAQTLSFHVERFDCDLQHLVGEAARGARLFIGDDLLIMVRNEHGAAPVMDRFALRPQPTCRSTAELVSPEPVPLPAPAA